VYDGSAFQPVTITSGEIIYAGNYRADTNKITSLTAAGTAQGYTVGAALQAAAAANNRYYFVCDKSGTGTSPAPTVTINPPDMILSNGSTYEKLDISNFIAGQVASNIGVTATGGIQNTNVQSVLEELDTEKLNTTGGTLTGNLALNQSSSIIFEGATPNDFESTLTVIDPTADRTLSLPNVTGTLVSSGDTGTVTSTMILDGTILNADINASAAIALTKLADVTAAQIIVGNASNVPTAVAVTGDISISNAGLVAITADSIVNADIKSDAAISGSKIVAGTTSVVGVVQLTDSAASSSTTTAATPAAVKVAKDAADAAATTANAALATTGGTLTNNLIIDNAKQIRFTEADSNGANFVSLQAPDALAADVSYTLPSAAPTANGQVLAGTTAGVLSWTDDPTGQWVTNGTNVYYDGGNVGIGVGNSPSEKLEVEGTVQVLNELRSKTGNDLKINAGSANRDIFLQVNDSTLMTLQGSTGTATFTGEIHLSSNGSLIKENQLKFSPAGAAYIDHETNDQDINFRVSNSTDGTLGRTALVIKADGKCGIGTTSPAGKLETRDATRANIIIAKTGLTVKQNSDLHTSYDVIQLGAGGALISYNAASVTADTQLGHNFYRHSGGTWKRRYEDTAMRFRMNSPANTFIWERAVSGAADLDISWLNSMTLDGSGNVGIGTTSPTGKLSVHNSDDANLNTIEAFNDNGNLTGSFSQNSAGDGTIGSNKNDGTLNVFFRSNGDSYIKGGNLGIGGITTPSSPLHVKGIDTTIGIHTYPQLTLETASTDGAADKGSGIMFLNHDGSSGKFGGNIRVLNENATSGNHASYMSFSTRPAGGSVSEGVRITSTGQLIQYGQIGVADTSADDLVIGDTTGSVNRGMTIYSHNAQNGSIVFADNNSNFRGAVQYLHNGDRFRILTGGVETLRLQSGGTDGVCTFFMGGVTNDNNKIGALTLNHYTFNTYNQIDLIKGTSVSGSNLIEIGGSGSSANSTAATEIKLFTASNSITNNGTERLRCASDGTIYINSSDSASGGRLYATGSAMYIQSGNGRQSFIVHDAASGVNRSWEITTDGNLKAPNTKGIDFSATSDATGKTSELLDDYEEGTWTPVLASTGTAFTSVTNWSSSSQNRYTKIGRIVTIQCYHRTGGVDKGSAASTDGIEITGLPFTPTNVVQRSMVPIGQNVNWAGYPNHALVRENIASVELYKSASSGGNNTGTPLTVADVGTAANNNYAIFTLVYESA
jgi:hypothetical protein